MLHYNFLRLRSTTYNNFKTPCKFMTHKSTKRHGGKLGRCAVVGTNWTLHIQEMDLLLLDASSPTDRTAFLYILLPIQDYIKMGTQASTTAWQKAKYSGSKVCRKVQRSVMYREQHRQGNKKSARNNGKWINFCFVSSYYNFKTLPSPEFFRGDGWPNNFF